MQDISTALLASNLFLNNPNLLQSLAKNKLQTINKTPINTKESILPEVEAHKPNYLLISSTLPGVIEVLEVITKTKQVSPKTKIVLILNESDKAKILNYFLGDADALIWFDNILELLEAALKQTNKGKPFICSTTTSELKALMQKQNVEGKSDEGLLNLLTDREVEVLYSLTQGINYKQISKLLFISESTVKTHINNIFTKLNVNDRTQAVLYALHHGISNLFKKPNLFKELIGETVQK